MNASAGDGAAVTAGAGWLSRVAERLVATGYGVGWSVVKAVPLSVADRAFTAAADTAFRRRGPSTVQLARNLKRVLGDTATPASLSAVTKAALRSYARYWLETFRLPSMDHDAVVATMLANLPGVEHVRAALDAGRGIVMPLPHSGNWDVAGLAMARTFGGISTVAERLKPASLFDEFVAYRESLGFEVLPLTGGPNPSTVLRQRLREGKIVCLVADRDLSASGIAVDFFGEPTRMPAGPAMLAAVTGADLCPTHLYYLDGGWAGDISAPLTLRGTRLRDQVADGTQQMADFFAAGIARHPADWHMVQPLWPADLPLRPDRAPATAAAASP